MANRRPTIAVVGASGSQGGSVVRALQTDGRFHVRALTRDPAKHLGLADEVVAADLDRPDTLAAAFTGAHGVFMMTNFWEEGGADEVAQGTAAVKAAKAAQVNHFIWSTLPDVEAISQGKYNVPHYTGKSKVDAVVAGAGFPHHTFAILPFLYENLKGIMPPQAQPDGSVGWRFPIDPTARVIHVGGVDDFGRLVAAAFAKPDLAGHGQYLPLVGQQMSFGDIVATLNAQGHEFTFTHVLPSDFAPSFPGEAEFAETLRYFEEYTYLGGNRDTEISLAHTVAGAAPSDFATWARAQMPAATTESPSS